MIEVTNLTKRYGSHVAVDHISFRVEKGQIYGFLGPNGAGKSTTMNMLTGYLAASEGTITIDGKDIQKEPEEAKRKIGYLPELPPLYTEMTVEEYLFFAAELKKIPRGSRREQVERVMELTQTADVRGRLIRNLSKGYRQRVGLAQAILGDPEVIILDEPSVGLDPKQMIEIRDLIRRLGESHTIILSSHILSEVSAVCDHIMIISKGKLVASDSPEGLEKLMEGSMELYLTAKGEEKRLLAVLEALPCVERVEREGTAESGCTRVKLSAADKEDIREKVFYALADAGLPIMELRPGRKTLEDIFLELTGADAASGETSAEEEAAGGEQTAAEEAEPGEHMAGEETMKEAYAAAEEAAGEEATGKPGKAEVR